MNLEMTFAASSPGQRSVCVTIFLSLFAKTVNDFPTVLKFLFPTRIFSALGGGGVCGYEKLLFKGVVSKENDCSGK